MYFRKEGGSDEEGEVKEEELHPLATVSNINPEDIPDVPVNRFLMRGGSNREKKDEKQRDDRRNVGRNDRFGDRRNWDRRNYRRDRIPSTTKSGRVIKGRGVFVRYLFVYIFFRDKYICIGFSVIELHLGVDPAAQHLYIGDKKKPE